MTLRLADDWVWDSWYALDGDTVHAFFLHAPKVSGDWHGRHFQARVGHAVSTDLRNWELRGEALGPGPAGRFDDRAIWTGSVLRHRGRWLMFYTGLCHRDGLHQRIGLAVSDDLDVWTRTDLALEADPRWYEKAVGTAEEYWRDPWAFVGPDGAVHLLVTARANQGPLDGRGVIGHTWSHDLRSWEVGPPLTEPGELFQLEVPQLVDLGGRWAVLFSARAGDWSAARRASTDAVPVSGTHYLLGEGPLGPFALAPGPFLLGSVDDRVYAARLVRRPAGDDLLAFADSADGRYIGEIGDPIPVVVDRDGLRLARRDESRVGGKAG